MNTEKHPVEPTEKQIENARLMGWIYQPNSGGLFFKGQNVGYFTDDGWSSE